MTSNEVSLGVIITLLSGGVGLSLALPPNDEEAEEQQQRQQKEEDAGE